MKLLKVFHRSIYLSVTIAAGACASTVELPAEPAVVSAWGESAGYSSDILRVGMVETPAAQEPVQNKGLLLYFCPMHEDMQSDKPGRCPKCGMKLKKREEAHEHH